MKEEFDEDADEEVEMDENGSVVALDDADAAAAKEGGESLELKGQSQHGTGTNVGCGDDYQEEEDGAAEFGNGDGMLVDGLDQYVNNSDGYNEEDDGSALDLLVSWEENLHLRSSSRLFKK